MSRDRRDEVDEVDEVEMVGALHLLGHGLARRPI